MVLPLRYVTQSSLLARTLVPSCNSVAQTHIWAPHKHHHPTLKQQLVIQPSSALLDITQQTFLTQVHTYKVRTVMKKRCHGCYMVTRHGRIYVECKLKPRHKQMQLVSKEKLDRMRENWCNTSHLYLRTLLIICVAEFSYIARTLFYLPINVVKINLHLCCCLTLVWHPVIQ